MKLVGHWHFVVEIFAENIRLLRQIQLENKLVLLHNTSRVVPISVNVSVMKIAWFSCTNHCISRNTSVMHAAATCSNPYGELVAATNHFNRATIYNSVLWLYMNVMQMSSEKWP